MFEKYFVLTAEQYFGVFEVGSASYPDALLENLQDTVCMSGSDEIMRYLLNHPNVGRNVLNKSHFKFPYSIGSAYYHEAKGKRRQD